MIAARTSLRRLGTRSQICGFSNFRETYANAVILGTASASIKIPDHDLSEIRIISAAGSRLVELYRPKTGNILNIKNLSELAYHTKSYDDNYAVSVVFYASNTSDVFSNGFQSGDLQTIIDTLECSKKLTKNIFDSPKLNIAVYGGDLSGSAYSVFATSQLRFATLKANFYIDDLIAKNSIPIGGLAYFLCRSQPEGPLGKSLARYLAICGKTLGCEGLFYLNLVDNIVGKNAHHSLMEALAESSPTSYAFHDGMPQINTTSSKGIMRLVELISLADKYSEGIYFNDETALPYHYEVHSSNISDDSDDDTSDDEEEAPILERFKVFGRSAPVASDANKVSSKPLKKAINKPILPVVAAVNTGKAAYYGDCLKSYVEMLQGRRHVSFDIQAENELNDLLLLSDGPGGPRKKRLVSNGDGDGGDIEEEVEELEYVAQFYENIMDEKVDASFMNKLFNDKLLLGVTPHRVHYKDEGNAYRMEEVHDTFVLAMLKEIEHCFACDDAIECRQRLLAIGAAGQDEVLVKFAADMVEAIDKIDGKCLQGWFQLTKYANDRNKTFYDVIELEKKILTNLHTV